MIRIAASPTHNGPDVLYGNATPHHHQRHGSYVGLHDEGDYHGEQEPEYGLDRMGMLASEGEGRGVLVVYLSG